MRAGRGLAAALVMGAWCATSHGSVVLVEHNGYSSHYYDVSWDHFGRPNIRILQPSKPGIPYWFECYDDSTNAPADIGSIIGTASIGNVVITVTGYGPRTFGAYDLYRLDFSQTGVHLTIQQLVIPSRAFSRSTRTRLPSR